VFAQHRGRNLKRDDKTGAKRSEMARLRKLLGIDKRGGGHGGRRSRGETGNGNLQVARGRGRQLFSETYAGRTRRTLMPGGKMGRKKVTKERVGY